MYVTMQHHLFLHSMCNYTARHGFIWLHFRLWQVEMASDNVPHSIFPNEYGSLASREHGELWKMNEHDTFRLRLIYSTVWLSAMLNHQWANLVNPIELTKMPISGHAVASTTSWHCPCQVAERQRPPRVGLLHTCTAHGNPTALRSFNIEFAKQGVGLFRRQKKSKRQVLTINMIDLLQPFPRKRLNLQTQCT